MPQSLSEAWLHLIFSTKNRARYLQNKQVRVNVHAYLAGICNRKKSPALIVGGVEDHVHLLCKQSRNVSIQELVQNIKQQSSKWVKQQWSDLDCFYWQQGYGAFSVSPTHIEGVRQYILEQEKHHHKMGFQDEFRSFLNRYQVAYDERYVWD